MNIHVYIGTSGSGKTTKIYENNPSVNDSIDSERDGIKICETNDGKTILIGHYNVDRRCKGCDTLSMVILDKLISFVDKLIKEDKYERLILDGDRINNIRFFNFLLMHKDKVIVYYINVSLHTIHKRMPDCNTSFVKTTQTKTQNIVNEYKKKLVFITIEEEKKQWW